MSGERQKKIYIYFIFFEGFPNLNGEILDNDDDYKDIHVPGPDLSDVGLLKAL